MPGEVIDELPVAVKTLPEYSANNQAEMDFLIEALIMSKFKHRCVYHVLVRMSCLLVVTRHVSAGKSRHTYPRS